MGFLVKHKRLERKSPGSDEEIDLVVVPNTVQ